MLRSFLTITLRILWRNKVLNSTNWYQSTVFIIVALLALGIAPLTVTVQSLKVAWSNPVDALKYDRKLTAPKLNSKIN